jgi:hypothetical protein
MSSQGDPAWFVVCVSNGGFPASLEARKLYQVLPDREAEALDHLRVIDETGDDYLYPRELFRDVEIPPAVLEELRRAS